MGQRTWSIGICSLDVKARSKPMREILDRFLATDEFRVVVFGDKVILDEPVENWPGCDFLISFFSKGFPLAKVIQYTLIQKPFCVNDLQLQYLLLDRRLVLQTLDFINVPTPPRLVVDRDGGPKLSPEVKNRVERDFGVGFLDRDTKEPFECPDMETIRAGDKSISKPFVEKPVDSEDHNIYIYYPGQGMRKLFRKIGNRSSEHVAGITHIRDQESYVYEQFLPIDNFEDIKVYTVGPEYAYAETRKSPVVDGVVERNSSGKECRNTTQLTAEEKDIARRICMAFGQTICGFDIVRTNGKSHVIDVNGWSFVKGNTDYYNQCASILRETFLRVARTRMLEPAFRPVLENQWRLKRYISVFRHGDRTPKKKKRFEIVQGAHLKESFGNREVIVRDPCNIQKVLDRLNETEGFGDQDQKTLQALNSTLLKRGQGIDIKLQLKWTESDRMIIIVKWGGEFTHAGSQHSRELGENLRQDLWIINKTVLNNIRVSSSPERRVLATARIITKALMSIAGLPPGFIRIKEKAPDEMDTRKQIEEIKRQLGTLVHSEKVTDMQMVGLTNELSHPNQVLTSLVSDMAYHRLIFEENLRGEKERVKWREPWCCSDGPVAWRERWKQIFEKFECVERVDASRLTELYDIFKYDMIHNQKYTRLMFTDNSRPESQRRFKELFQKTKLLNDLVAPNEYGILQKDKLNIGQTICRDLLKCLVDDLKEAGNIHTGPGIRLHFTTESQILPLFNCLMCMLAKSPHQRYQQVSMNELDYLAQLSLEVYERKNDLVKGEAEYAVRIGFSPGAYHPGLVDTQLISHVLSVAPRQWLTDHVGLEYVIGILGGQCEG